MATYIKPEAIKDASLPIGKVAAMSENERLAFLVSLGLGKIGVVSQKQTWAKDYSGYTMSNLVWGMIPQANIDLFISAGAEFNDTDAPITKTAPWGEQVQHLPGYFYLNGLGNISYNEMIDIYNQTNAIKNSKVLDGALSGENGIFTCRTNIPWNLGWDGITNTVLSSSFAYQTPISVFLSNRTSMTFDWMSNSFSGISLQYIIGDINLESLAAQNRMPSGMSSALRYVRFIGLKYNLTLSSRWIGRDSIRYMIDKASNTTAISIKIHADVYARLTEEDKAAATAKNINLVIA